MESTDSNSLFETASRLKLRFETPSGLLTVEDLWDLPLTSTTGRRTSLDAIAVALHKSTRDAADTVSFVTPEAPSLIAEMEQLRFDIVRHVIKVRVAEYEALRQAGERKARKQRLLELIAQKEDAALGERPVDELRALAESL